MFLYIFSGAVQHDLDKMADKIRICFWIMTGRNIAWYLVTKLTLQLNKKSFTTNKNKVDRL